MKLIHLHYVIVEYAKASFTSLILDFPIGSSSPVDIIT